jgi:hypothetical protein
MMPVTFEKSATNLKPVMRCEICGQYASHGLGVNLSAAIDRKDAKLAGTWFCRQHLPNATK